MADRRHLRPVLLALAILAGWLAFARLCGPAIIAWVLRGESPELVRRLVLRGDGTDSLERVLERWNAFSSAVFLAGLCHLAFILFLNRLDRRPGAAASRPDGRSWVRRALPLVSLAFLACTVWTGAIQDYELYLIMWKECRSGHDPWFYTAGVFGQYPLNAYGPVFNVLAMPAWIHPLLPKLIFATSYLVFAGWLSLAVGGRDGSPLALRVLVLAVLWSPFVWFETAVFGHFDILVGLLCLAAVEARVRGSDTASGLSLSAGVLLKYMPAVLAPYLAIHGESFRWRLVVICGLTAALGLALGYLVWGDSIVRPIVFAASRSSHHLSIFRYLRGAFSPLPGWELGQAIESWALVILLVAHLRLWNWSRLHRVEPVALSVMAILVTLLLYRVGFGQYQMVLLVLAANWLARYWREASRAVAPALALAAYFGWLSVYDGLLWFDVTSRFLLEEWIGLLTFLLGILLLACVAISSRKGGVAERAAPAAVPVPSPGE